MDAVPTTSPSDLGDRSRAGELISAAASFEVVHADVARKVFFEAIRASVAARTGDHAQAIASLQRLMQMPVTSTVAPGLLSLDPDWDALRSDPGFAQLLARYGRRAAPGAGNPL